MRSEMGMRVVGTIRSIELHTTAKFEGISPRQIAKIALDIERAQDEEGRDINVENLANMCFQGPVELVPRFSEGERVQITTAIAGGIQIASIRRAPLS
ncbi:MAG TPA: hypothetical protein PLF40_23620 [Kofleriaceae bacterium]|nr:hypothetical protein [Kofleriaceae bacterium]